MPSCRHDTIHGSLSTLRTGCGVTFLFFLYSSSVGTLMLQHHDLIHRGTMRQLESDENPWRPMIAFRGAIRVSEDSTSNDIASGVRHSHHSLGAALAVHPSAQLSRTEVADPASLAQIIETSASEARRISAAYHQIMTKFKRDAVKLLF